MTALVFYLIKSVLCSCGLLAYYWLFLRNKNLHQFNRFFLLFTVMVSIVLPLVHIEWQVSSPVVSDTAVFRLLEVNESNKVEQPEISDTSNLFSIYQLVMFGYGIVALLLLSIVAFRVMQVLRLRKQFEATKHEDYYLYRTELSKAPFSFFNILFWKNAIDINSNEGQQILTHELTHIRQYHTLDKLFVQISCALFWFNPFFWFIQKELSMVHEFIADEAANEDKNTERFARMLLQTQFGSGFSQVIHPFFHSPIKRRLIMLQKTHSIRFASLRKLMLLPLVAVGFVLVSFEMKDATHTKAKQKILLALDAGHGGKDHGAKSDNGISEKDLTLKVANKIAELAPDYNIETVKLRDANNYPTLQERPAIAKNAGADLYLSIHVNATESDDKAKLLPYELIVNEQNQQYEKCHILASAIATQLQEHKLETQLSQRHLVVLAKADVPSVTIELGNINNNTQIAALNNDEQLEALCRRILAGIVVYQNNMK